MMNSQPLAQPVQVEQLTPSAPDVKIILMEPAGHGHKSESFVWTANKVTLLIVLTIIAGSLLWFWGEQIYSQYQAENAALQLEKQAVMAKKAQELERIRLAWQEQREHALQLHQLQQKEAEEAHIAWQNYYKAQALQTEHKR